ncbi:NifB/NifX family molybdenum-iron cluster-binding protein [Methanococcoides sp. FTZ1]|uniref:NifB/NifX family molybdenum-iron cluster-binding protein n=1 Tax=Methanococcoides sp. FTZ1 TaxID=3439061 RepID=UPI003F8315EE
MKICVTAAGECIDAEMDTRFGRCPYFVIVDSETMDLNAIKNPAASTSGGAGIQAAQSIADKEINVLLTGKVGPNAFPILSAAGIKVMAGASGSVADAVKQYKEGLLQETSAPTAEAHASMAASGRGMGGRGSSGGSGRGTGNNSGFNK